MEDIEYSSLCYTVGPCCLSILYIVVNTSIFIDGEPETRMQHELVNWRSQILSQVCLALLHGTTFFTGLKRIHLNLGSGWLKPLPTVAC